MKAFLRLIVGIILAWIVYAAVDQLRFEVRLHHLEQTCAGLKLGRTYQEVATDLQAQRALYLSAPKRDADDAHTTYAYVILDSILQDGWSCGCVFKDGQLTESVFGSDHGARESFIRR